MVDLESGHRNSRRLWVFAGVVALGLHLGGAALAIAHLAPDVDEDSLGAPVIEVGVELTSSKVEATDLPPGPDVDASVASPQVEEQKAEVKEADLPKDRPTDVDEADRAVTPNEPKKPKEEDKKVAVVETAAAMESLSQEATATPNVEGRPDDKTRGVKQGIGNSAELAKVTWEKKIMAHFKKNLQFPEGAKAKSKTIQVTLNVEFDRLGHVIEATIAEGSGQAAFDEAALKMIRRSDPVPQPPPLVADQGLKRVLPVIFNDPKR